jgi:hypothetical protein
MDETWNWQDESMADRLREADPMVIAQEFLRCNAIYAASFRRLTRRLPSDGAIRRAELAGFAWPWGLDFPVRSRSPLVGGTRVLAQ